jgi:hypothetical protein
MKCSCCKKKTHLDFKCACGAVVCMTCRLPEVHGCTVKEGQKVDLPKVVAEKVSKI